MDNKRGTNAAEISSLRRSCASTVKVDAPSLTEMAPALAGPRVVSPAARPSIKTVEKHWPPPAERSHQSATSPLCKGGGAGHTAQSGLKLRTKAHSLPLKLRTKPSLRSPQSRQITSESHVETCRHLGVAASHPGAATRADGALGTDPHICKSPRSGHQTRRCPFARYPGQLQILPRFLLDELHRKPKGARMHPNLPRSVAQSALDVAHFARPQWRKRSSVDVPLRLATSSAMRATILGPFHRGENSRHPNAILGSGDQTTEGPTTSSPPTVTDHC